MLCSTGHTGSEHVTTIKCLQAGYAVIFLHRRHSIQPFTKGLPSGQILDFLTSVLEPDEGVAASSTAI